MRKHYDFFLKGDSIDMTSVLVHWSNIRWKNLPNYRSISMGIIINGNHTVGTCLDSHAIL